MKEIKAELQALAAKLALLRAERIRHTREADSISTEILNVMSKTDDLYARLNE
jgi:hypothetical protein